MRIPAITSLICECWEEAEKSVRTLLTTHYLDKGEEFITELFHGQFRVAVDKASTTGKVYYAFRSDLGDAFPGLHYSQEMDRISNGIRATTILHPKKVEEKTGGDLGILLIRPNITADPYDRSLLNIDDEYQRGLLCQAKIKRRPTVSRRSYWGTLSNNQKMILSQHTEYLSLVLYQYTDEDRLYLAPFHWQICRGASIDSVQEWLQKDNFPSLILSADAIKLLGSDEIGTDDKDIIKEFVCPTVRDSLIIHIGWPPGDPPPARVRLWQESNNQQQVRVLAT